MKVEEKYMYLNINILRAIFLLLLIMSFHTFANDLIRIDILTNKKCNYSEFTTLENSVERKKAIVSWNGACKNGYINGFGKLEIKIQNQSIQVEEVNFLNGLEDGYGKELTTYNNINTTIEFIGDFKNGEKINGQEIVIHDDQKYIYKGPFEHGIPNGIGVIVYPNSNTYEGYVRNRIPNGNGIWKIANGDVYQGSWSYGKITGKGKLRLNSNGSVIDGNFVDGKPNGYCQINYENHDLMKVKFINGLADGLGYYEKANGEILYFRYKMGKRLSVESLNKINETADNSSYRSDNETNINDKRQKGIDSLTCEAYANNSVINRGVSLPPTPVDPSSALLSGLSALLQGGMIGLDRNQAYDSCMKRLGY